MTDTKEAKKILDALLNEALGDDADESMIAMVSASFSGRRRWLTAITWTMSFIWFAAAVYCAIRFFDASAVQHQIAWATAFLFSMMAVTALKIWAWMDMLHTSTRRELKRIEAAMVRLAEVVGSK